MTDFTPVSCFSANEYDFVFTSTQMLVYTRLTNDLISSFSYTDGFAIKSISGDLCIGNVSYKEVFAARLDTSSESFGLKLSTTEKGVFLLGSDNIENPIVTRQTFAISKTAVKLSSKANILTIEV